MGDTARFPVDDVRVRIRQDGEPRLLDSRTQRQLFRDGDRDEQRLVLMASETSYRRL